MPHTLSRRSAIKAMAAAGLAVPLLPHHAASATAQPEGIPPHTTISPARISLAQWSLHKPLQARELHHLDFAREARAMGFGAIEYVNTFFKTRANDERYIAQMNLRAADQGVQQLLIMCDGEGRLGAPAEDERRAAVENHRKWLNPAKALGCHAIRVNTASEGSPDEQQRLNADGLRRLCELADPLELSVLVENHGGLSSNGQWLAQLIRRVDHPRIGTLPDFGNFCMDWSRKDEPDAWYDRYLGMTELMPLARAVSAKSYEFDEHGNETTIDYPRMIAIVRAAGYDGWIGVEYEGDRHPPREGIRLTRELLERLLTAPPPMRR